MVGSIQKLLRQNEEEGYARLKAREQAARGWPGARGQVGAGQRHREGEHGGGEAVARRGMVCCLAANETPHALLCLVYCAGRVQSCFPTILCVPTVLPTRRAPRLDPASCILHPAPCTLHPAPCPLPPAPCTLNSIPHSDTLPMHMCIPLCTA